MAVPSAGRLERLLLVYNSKTKAFPILGPHTVIIWNDLLANVTSAESLSPFCQRLKANLFFKSGH